MSGMLGKMSGMPGKMSGMLGKTSGMRGKRAYVRHEGANVLTERRLRLAVHASQLHAVRRHKPLEGRRQPTLVLFGLLSCNQPATNTLKAVGICADEHQQRTAERGIPREGPLVEQRVHDAQNALRNQVAILRQEHLYRRIRPVERANGQRFEAGAGALRLVSKMHRGRAVEEHSHEAPSPVGHRAQRLAQGVEMRLAHVLAEAEERCRHARSQQQCRRDQGKQLDQASHKQNSNLAGDGCVQHVLGPKRAEELHAWEHGVLIFILVSGGSRLGLLHVARLVPAKNLERADCSADELAIDFCVLGDARGLAGNSQAAQDARRVFYVSLNRPERGRSNHRAEALYFCLHERHQRPRDTSVAKKQLLSLVDGLQERVQNHVLEGLAKPAARAVARPRRKQSSEAAPRARAQPQYLLGMQLRRSMPQVRIWKRQSERLAVEFQQLPEERAVQARSRRLIRAHRLQASKHRFVQARLVGKIRQPLIRGLEQEVQLLDPRR
eukprot:scaffold1596_cov302-Pinguiococcus_pyrenoidosus.AAC.37